MNDILKLAETEIMRKEILQLCNAAVPIGCSRQVLEATLGKMGMAATELDQQLYYLQEKSLIKVEHAGNARLKIQRDIYSITASGMDYLDGNGPDVPGIGV